MVSVFDSFITLEWGIATSKWRTGRSIACEQEAEAACTMLVQLFVQNEFRQKLRTGYGGGYDATNSENTFSSNTLKGSWSLFPACSACSMIAAGSQQLLRSRLCSLTTESVSELICALVGALPSVWAGLSLLDSFSENVRKRKSHQWVYFWIKPLVLRSQKSLSKETDFLLLEHNKYELENEAPTFPSS